MRVIIDIESNGFIEDGIDYSELPYRLKPSYKVWCIVIRNIDNNKVTSLKLKEVTKENLSEALEGVTEIAGHNIICFDLPVLFMAGLLDYRVGYPGEPSTINGRECLITDTLLWSKILEPDRYGGHSLEAWGKRFGNYKGDFHEFDQYSEEMLEYCIQDTNVNAQLYRKIQIDKQIANYDRAMSMEVKMADIIFRQSLFGFAFDLEKAQWCLQDLDEKLKTIKDYVSPRLPPRKMTQLELKNFTPPKIQFKKDGTTSANLEKFREKHNATIVQRDSDLFFIYKDRELSLPITEPLETTAESDIDDLDNLKKYLIDLGWEPSEWKERDLTKKADKTKRNREEMLETIDRYVKQTFRGYFSKERCEFLGINHSEHALHSYLLGKVGDNSVYVPSGPKIAVGVDKTLCPKLEELGDKADFVGDVVKYLTYKHRRNMIAGGGFEYDPDTDDEPETGFLSSIREDGRIGTPADTLAASTGRFRHKKVCNLPRVTSLYGEYIRGLFSPGYGMWQLGFDFASLEARIQGHFCMPYTDGPLLAHTLLQEKPNDIHTLTAAKMGISRNDAKSVNYASMYGASPRKIAKMLKVSESRGKEIYDAFWDSVPALKELKEKLEKHWENNQRKYVLGIDGRLLCSRSKHSLINLIFQSAGALSMKWANVRIIQRMEKEGIYIDPLIDSLSKVGCIQLIQYHDEVQFAVNPKLLKVKLFKTDEEAKAAMVPGCSAIGHGSKGPYLAYETTPVVCIKEGIKEVERELGTRVEMGIEWIVGSNYAQTH